MFKFNQATAQDQFWDWFSHHSENYFEFEKNQESLFNDLTQALDQVQPGLAFEFGPKENGVRDFVISADGNRELFLPVTQLVKAAPLLKQWNVVAFRQRREAECEILINDVVMTTAKIFFKLEPDGDKIGITLFFTDYESMRERTLLTAALLLIDNALGEYDVETKVGFIERQHLQECENRDSLLPFKELPIAFDTFYASFHN